MQRACFIMLLCLHSSVITDHTQRLPFKVLKLEQIMKCPALLTIKSQSRLVFNCFFIACLLGPQAAEHTQRAASSSPQYSTFQLTAMLHERWL